jgi:hypothetical protein
MSLVQSARGDLRSGIVAVLCPECDLDSAHAVGAPGQLRRAPGRRWLHRVSEILFISILKELIYFHFKNSESLTILRTVLSLFPEKDISTIYSCQVGAEGPTGLPPGIQEGAAAPGHVHPAHDSTLQGSLPQRTIVRYNL